MPARPAVEPAAIFAPADPPDVARWRLRRGAAGRPSADCPSSAAADAGFGSSQRQLRIRLSSRRAVRSSWIGVTAMRRLTTAWKSVPWTASPDGGGPPIQK